jgi:hypothetical protein
MKIENRHQGRMIRRVVRLHRAWENNLRTGGRVENDLAWQMGRAYRAGIGADMERARRRASTCIDK